MTALQRHIGLSFLVLYGMGDILGAGIYGLVGKAAGQMGSAVWLAFIASMCAAGFTGLSYASLGSRYPKAGGASFITLEAFRNKFLSYVVGLAVVASGLTSMATASRVFAGYFSGRFPSISVEFVIVAFAVILAYVIFRGIRETMWANAVCTLIEVSGLLLVLAVGASYVGSVSLLDARTPSNPTGDLTVALMLSGAVLTFYSFIGFEDILNVAEEVKDPVRTLPRGLIIAVVLSSLVYMGISIVAVSVIPAAELAESKQPLVDVVAKAAPWFPTSIYSMIAMFAVANTALLNFVMGSRMFYGMGQQGLLPSIFTKVHPTRKTPHIAILTVLVILLALAFVGDVAALAKATSVLLLTCFTIVNGALIYLKYKGTDWKDAFQVPMFVPILGIVICVAMLTHAQSAEVMIAGALVAVISVLYFVLKPKNVVGA